MAEWIARLAVEISFEAKDANEASEIADTLRAVRSFGGHKIERVASGIYAAPVDDDSNQDTRDEA